MFQPLIQIIFYILVSLKKYRFPIFYIATLLVFVSVLNLELYSFAENNKEPSGAFIFGFFKYIKSELVIRSNGERHGKPINYFDELRSRNQILEIPGDKNSWVSLGFIRGHEKYDGMLYKSNPSKDNSSFWFPCTTSGGFTIAWQSGDRREACEKGISVSPDQKHKYSSNQQLVDLQIVPEQKQILITSKKIRSDKRVCKKVKKRILIVWMWKKVCGHSEDIIFDMILGDTVIKTKDNSKGVPVKEGNRFTYPGGKITKIDSAKEANSCDTHKFLNLAYWEGKNKPKSVVNDIHEQIKDHRKALGIFGSKTNLSQLEQEVFEETNLARTNPKVYAKFIEARRANYKGKEGLADVNEAIKFLEEVDPIPALEISRGMSRASKDHVSDHGSKGKTGHIGTDGSKFYDRLSRYGNVGCPNHQFENISYGLKNGRDIVVQLIIDYGLPSRGHRKAIFNRDLQVTGIACGSHSIYGSMCTIVYAGGYKENI